MESVVTVALIDRAMRYGELIPKQHRGWIAAMLGHADERVRAYASQIVVADQRSRQERAAASLEEASLEEASLEEGWPEEASLEEPLPVRGFDGVGGSDDADDIPF